MLVAGTFPSLFAHSPKVDSRPHGNRESVYLKRKVEKQDVELHSAEYSEAQPGIIERLPKSSDVGEATSTMSTCAAGSVMATVSSTVTANIPGQFWGDMHRSSLSRDRTTTDNIGSLCSLSQYCLPK